MCPIQAVVSSAHPYPQKCLYSMIVLPLYVYVCVYVQQIAHIIVANIIIVITV